MPYILIHTCTFAFQRVITISLSEKNWLRTKCMVLTSSTINESHIEIWSVSVELPSGKGSMCVSAYVCMYTGVMYQTK